MDTVEHLLATLTVQDLYKLALPAGAEIVGGVAGLVRLVSWVRVAQLDQASLERIEAGDLVLVAAPASGRPSRHATLAPFLTRLAELGAAGVATAGASPPGAGAIADAIGIPLIRLPAGVKLAQIEKQAIRLIINRRAEIEQRGVQIYRELAQQTIDNLGIEAIAEKLVELTGKLVVVEDPTPSLQLLAMPPISTVTREELQVSLRDPAEPSMWFDKGPMASTSPPVVMRQLNAPGWARYVAPIVVRGAIFGYLSLIGPADELDEIDRMAAGRGAAVCAIEMAKQMAIRQAESRIRSDFIDDLISGSLNSDAAIISRGQLLGYDLTKPHAVAVIELDTSEAYLDWLSKHNTHSVQELRQGFANVLNTALARRQPRAMMRIKGENAVFIWPSPAEGGLAAVRAAVDDLRQEVSRATPMMTASAAVGRLYARPSELSRAFREAEQALTIALRLYGGDRTTAFEELGVYRLLFHLHGTPELAGFQQETLSKLIGYDKEHEGELIKTLRAFFANHGNLSRTAEQLILHRNTVTYRLERIEELTGLDLENEDDRFRLQLALKLTEMV